MQYPTISPQDAARYLKGRDGDSPVALDDIVRYVGSGDRISEHVFDALRSKLLQLKSRFPKKLRSRDPQGGKFENEALELVHGAMSSVDRTILGDPEFWVWLAVAKLSDVLEWRFGTEGRHAKLANYGIGNRIENLYFRLWLRADLGRSPESKDAYMLAKTGDQDLWRSHLLRQNYTNARSIARSILKLQAGKLVLAGKVARSLASGDDPMGVRMLAKRVKRLKANVLFEFLPQKEVDQLIFELSADLRKAK
jgi:hypothetical protein